MRIALFSAFAMAAMLACVSAKAADTTACDKTYQELQKKLQNNPMPSDQLEKYQSELLGAYNNCKAGTPDWMGITNRYNSSS